MRRTYSAPILPHTENVQEHARFPLVAPDASNIAWERMLKARVIRQRSEYPFDALNQPFEMVTSDWANTSTAPLRGFGCPADPHSAGLVLQPAVRAPSVSKVATLARRPWNRVVPRGVPCAPLRPAPRMRFR